MKRITYEEFVTAVAFELWTHIKSLQAELDRLEKRETMTVEEIVKVLCDKSDDWCNLQGWEQKEIARFIQPLTVQQGFVPDWSKAPEWAVNWQGVWLGDGMKISDACPVIPRPTPPKKMRDRTKGELLDLYQRIVSKRFGWPHGGEVVWQFISEELADGNALCDLCTAAGIPTTKEEV